jgi:hypothetical protein
MKELADEYRRLLHRKTVRCQEVTDCQVSREMKSYMVRNFKWMEVYYEKQEIYRRFWFKIHLHKPS